MEYYLISSKKLKNKQYLANNPKEAAVLAYKDMKKIYKNRNNFGLLLQDMNGGTYHFFSNQKGGAKDLTESINKLSTKLSEELKEEVNETFQKIQKDVENNVYTENYKTILKNMEDLKNIFEKNEKNMKNNNEKLNEAINDNNEKLNNIFKENNEELSKEINTNNEEFSKEIEEKINSNNDEIEKTKNEILKLSKLVEKMDCKKEESSCNIL